MSVTTERVASLVAPIAERMGLHLYDVDQPGGTLRVMLDRDGGVDVDTLAEATRAISRELDAEDPVAGSYTLEVSSPGLERPLRTAAHFAAAVGQRVKIKLAHVHRDHGPEQGAAGDRRVDGVLVAVDGDRLTVDTGTAERILDRTDVTSAHTVFEWQATPRPGGQKKRRKEPG